jgi:hypothetical protein
VGCSNKLIALEELDALVLKFIDRSQTPPATRSSASDTARDSVSLTYYWDDWARIVDYLHSYELDADAANAAHSPYRVATMIERNSDLWDDPDAPQMIWMELWEQQTIMEAAALLEIGQAPPPFLS